MGNETKIMGKCPICGGNVVKVLKGYACVNSFQQESPCTFTIGNLIANRRMKDEEIIELLDKRVLLADGCSTKEQKVFTTLLHFNQDGTIGIGNAIGQCPKCGGKLYINARAVGCGNFKEQSNPCNFTIWRNVFGHELTLDEIYELISKGSTEKEIECYDNTGKMELHKIGLNDAKEVVRL